jgi:hypothetical protein
MHKFLLGALWLSLAGCTGAVADTALEQGQKTENQLETQTETPTPVAVLQDIQVITREGGDPSGVANIACADNEVLMGGGCYCTGLYDDNEAGLLFSCVTNGTNNGYVGGCYSYNADQAATPVLVRLQCGVGATVDVVQAAPAKVAVEDRVEARVRAQAAAYNHRK